MYILSKEDWKDYAQYPEYGMPDYFKNRLVVAAEDNDFWKSFGSIAKFAAPIKGYARIKATYADKSGKVQMGLFFDLLVVHEIAHAFQDSVGFTFPTKWLSEIFADLALHSFVANVRPFELEHLIVAPDVISKIIAFNALIRISGYAKLDDFEQHYPTESKKPMNPQNYGWYQARFHKLAKVVFDSDGEAGLMRLWDSSKVFAYGDAKTSEALSKMLSSEVSQTLGQAIGRWH